MPRAVSGFAIAGHIGEMAPPLPRAAFAAGPAERRRVAGAVDTGDPLSPEGLAASASRPATDRTANMKRKERPAQAPEAPALVRAVHIPAGRAHLEGELNIPAGAPGIVLFAHGSGSSRHSPRNQFV